MALPPMLWPLNSALTQVAVNGLAEAADAANIAKLPELLRRALAAAVQVFMERRAGTQIKWG
jgi:hypothetical protein